MDRNEIVRAFLENGYQLGADALSYFEQNQDRVETFLDLAKGRISKTIISKKNVDEILSGISPKVRVVQNFISKRKETTVEEISIQLSNRYQKISEILSKRIDLPNPISINRISTQTKKFSLVAMVKELSHEDRSIAVEDPTGSAQVYIADDAVGDFTYIVEDEVIGLVCDNEDSSENRVTKIVFPDIPLATKITSSNDDVLCIFLSDIHMDDEKFMQHSFEKLSEYLKKIKQDAMVFVLGDVSSNSEGLKKFADIFPSNFSVMFLKGELEAEKDNYLPDPTIVEIGGVRIFLSHGKMFSKYFETFKISPENMLQQLVKKRHMSPTIKLNKGLDDNKLIIEDVPDIFVIGHFHQPHLANYKGTTFISLGSFVTEPVFYAVNLKTRESIKIDLT